MKPKTSLLHATRATLLTILVLATAITQVDPAKLNQLAMPSAANNVLAYATSMSRADLLAAANQSRAAHGLAPFQLNSLLNNSAQMKAQHMVDGNYWSHVSPDGIQPWYFFEVAGYGYTSAGENLAYGFATSIDTNTGWMNSPSHRANILGSYKEVGFGFVNGPNFQGKENTVVVAHYATPSISAPPPKPAPAPAPPPPPQPQPETLPITSEPAKEKITKKDATKETDEDKQDDSSKEQAPEESTNELIVNTQSGRGLPPVNIGSTASISVWQSILSGTLPQRFVISLSLIAFVLVGYGLTHRALLRQATASGQVFTLRHPILDILILTSAITIILTTSVAWLQ